MDTSEFHVVPIGGRGEAVVADDATGLQPKQRLMLYQQVLGQQCPLSEADVRGMWDDCKKLAQSEDPRAAARAVQVLNSIRMGNVKIVEVVLADSKPTGAAVSVTGNGPMQVNFVVVDSVKPQPK